MWKQQQTDSSHFLQNVTVKSYNEVKSSMLLLDGKCGALSQGRDKMETDELIFLEIMIYLHNNNI